MPMFGCNSCPLLAFYPIARYLVARRLEFGFLSCYYATYLVWRPLDDAQRLFISEPFLYDTAHPQATTLGALSWMQTLALKQRTDGKRHAPYEGPSGGGQLPGPFLSGVGGKGGSGKKQGGGPERRGGDRGGKGGKGGGSGRGQQPHDDVGKGEGKFSSKTGVMKRGGGAFKSETADYLEFDLPIVSPPNDTITRDCFLGSGESGQVYAGLLNGLKVALKVRKLSSAGSRLTHNPLEVVLSIH